MTSRLTLLKLLLILQYSIFNIQYISAQQYNFRTYSLEEGMAQSQVLSMCYDSRGRIWFGTYGSGVCIFDGTSFEYITSAQGLVNNSVWCIYEDSKNNLWFGTTEGISKYNGLSFTNYTLDDGLLSERVFAIIEDKNGNMIFGTEGGGISIFDGKDFRNLTEKDGLTSNNVYALLEDDSGKIWMGTSDNGLSIYDGKKFKSFTEENGLSNNNVNDIWQNDNGSVWICTDKGITVINKGETGYITVNDGLPHEKISTVLKDDKGHLWIATYGGGACRYDGKEFKNFTEKEGLSNNSIYDVIQEKSGCVWFGTNGGGASKYAGESFIHITKEQGLSNNMVMEVLEDSKGNLWIGTDGGGLNKFDGVSVTTFGEEDGLLDININAIIEDNKGNIWVATDEGISIYNGKKFTYITTQDGLAGDEIRDIFQDSKGNIWIGSSDGINLIQGMKVSNLKTEDELSNNTIWAITEDKKGNIWFATDFGALRYNGSKFQLFTKKDGLVSNVLISFTNDTDGNIWIGTENGLSYYDGSAFINYTVNDGLASGNIFSLIFDNERNLYVGTEKGIDKISFTADHEISKIRHFGYLDGFSGIECNANAVSKGSNGNIWFGTIGGVTSYDPGLEMPRSVEPQTHITNLLLFFEKPDWSQYSDSILPWSFLPDNLVLPANKNHLTFEFAGISLIAPERVKYKFMLDGFDEQWSPVTSKKEATYSNLPAGEYTFMVMASNDEGIWNREAASYSFIINKPFWQTWWFYSLCIVFVVAVIYLITSLRTGQLKKAKKELERNVRERTEVIYQQKKALENLSIVASETADGVLISDKDGKIEWMNAGLERMTGYNFEEFKRLVGATVREISSNPNIENVLEDIKANKKSASYDSMHQMKNGNSMWTTCTITPIFDNGQLKKVVMLYTDITKRKEAEDAIKQQNKNITDSINYAKQIQEAILPDEELLLQNKPNSFVLYLPKDIVSGDFYWFSKMGDVLVVCAADCTGHGVPGAFMSMIGNEFLHQIIKVKDITGPHLALQELDKKIIRALHQVGEEKETKDGMDIAMCAIHLNTNQLQFAGAHRPAIIVRNKEIIELKPDKISIGGFRKRDKAFKEHSMKLHAGDSLYLFSDGYTDQFGGSKGKKFLMKRFKELLIEINGMNMQEQKKALLQTFEDWKGTAKQVDDVLVIGIKI